MIAAGSAEYAAARMHAWLGRRPDAVAWRGLCEARGIAPMLDLLQGSTLAPLAGLLAHAPDLHALDRAACHAWSGVVGDAARWVDAALAPAVAWCAPLPLLPALAHLLRGGAAAPWMAAWPVLLQSAAPAQEGGATDAVLAALARTVQEPEALGGAWLAAWRGHLPGAVRSSASMERLATLVATHVRRFGAAPVHAAQPLRERLELGLLRHFRRDPQDPSAVFAWLGMAALDIRRLRGEFAWRIALPGARPLT